MRGESNDGNDETTRAAQGEGSARRASLLVYDGGLQGAFRFFTLAHFERDSQRKTRSEHNPCGGWIDPVRPQECGQSRHTHNDSQHWLPPDRTESNRRTRNGNGLLTHRKWLLRRRLPGVMRRAYRTAQLVARSELAHACVTRSARTCCSDRCYLSRAG